MEIKTTMEIKESTPKFTLNNAEELKKELNNYIKTRWVRVDDVKEEILDILLINYEALGDIPEDMYDENVKDIKELFK